MLSEIQNSQSLCEWHTKFLFKFEVKTSSMVKLSPIGYFPKYFFIIGLVVFRLKIRALPPDGEALNPLDFFRFLFVLKGPHTETQMAR